MKTIYVLMSGNYPIGGYLTLERLLKRFAKHESIVNTSNPEFNSVEQALKITPIVAIDVTTKRTKHLMESTSKYYINTTYLFDN
jgi:hypothetical protein